MISKASFKTHPLHPILVCFPIVFYIGTLCFDLFAVIKQEVAFGFTGQYLHTAAIVSAFVAAIPGLIDYTHTVPPNSSAKKRATKHAILNSSTLLIFIAALIAKRTDALPTGVIIAMEAVGVILTGAAGWLGGTLVHNNQIGVNNRYADSGKWKEFFTNDTEGRIEVASSNELRNDQMKLLHLKDKRIVLAKTEAGYVAFDDRCTHKGASLAGGVMICGTVRCPWHGSQFDVKTGEVKAGPGKEKIGTYPVQEVGGKVFLLM